MALACEHLCMRHSVGALRPEFAWQRGSDALDVGDLLFGFVMEDQNRFRELTLRQHPEASGPIFELESHPPSSHRCGVAPAAES